MGIISFVFPTVRRCGVIWPAHLCFRCLNLAHINRTQNTCAGTPHRRDDNTDRKTLFDFRGINSAMAVHFRPAAAWRVSHKSERGWGGGEGSFPAIQHLPQRGDNETQTGLKVQKPFLSHWEHVLDAHSSSFVLYVAICARC